VNYSEGALSTWKSIVIKYDSDGNIFWQNTLPFAFVNYDIQHAASDGGFLLTDFSTGKLRYVKINSQGQIAPACDNYDLPDLTRSSLGVLPSTLSQLDAGEIIEFDLTIINRGLVAAAGDFKINVYLSNDFILDGDDFLVNDYDFADVEAGTIEKFLVEVPIPANLPDDEYRIMISIDNGCCGKSSDGTFVSH